jgi:two-component system, chemotaxis family, chemotaxis protein CheY
MNKIWLVDDDMVFHYVVARYLSKLGCQHKLIGQYNGRQFLDNLRTCTPSDYPDLVLLDLWMPVMDGWSTLDLIANDYITAWKVPIVIVSSSIDPVDLQRAANSRLVANYLSKPFSLDQFRESLSVYIC